MKTLATRWARAALPPRAARAPKLLALVAVLLGLGAALPAHALTIEEIQKLLPDETGLSDNFGYSVAVEGDTAVVGAPRDASLGVQSGAVYVFARVDGLWQRQDKLVPEDGIDGGQFGWSVALDGDTLVVGARSDDDLGTASGAVYVYVRDTGVFTLQAKLLPSGSFDLLGVSVAISGDTVVAGAPGNDDLAPAAGAAFVYVREEDAWSAEAMLTASDGSSFEYFGQSVAVDGDTALVGGYGDEDRGETAGAAWVFVRVNGQWSEDAKLLPDDLAPGDQLGYSVALEGDTALVGAPAQFSLSPGAGYVFVRGAGGWVEQDKLTAEGAEQDAYVGWSVALEGDRAVLGGWAAGELTLEYGAAWLFARGADGAWAEQAKLVASDREPFDNLGWSVSLSGDTALVGAYGEDTRSTQAGAVYVFLLTRLAEQHVSALIRQLEILVEELGLPRGLLAHLRAAQAALAHGKRIPAYHQLRAFLNHIEAMIRSGKLTEAQAAEVIARAEEVIEALRPGRGVRRAR